MFPDTGELSKIISDTIKALFKRRLVDRVLRLWIEMARGQGFPRRDQLEPSKLGVDWRNCLVIAVQSPVQLSYLVAVGENLSFTHCPADGLGIKTTPMSVAAKPPALRTASSTAL